MAKRSAPSAAAGFSLVELMIALVFTGILMAGMSKVFQGTLSTFHASSEKTASARRNRMSLELMYEDLNNAGMYLADLATPPQLYSTNEAFSIVPLAERTAKESTYVAVDGVTQGQDTLYLLFDDPLPFEGTLDSTPARSAATLAALQTFAAATDFTYVIDCGDATFAQMVKKGQMFAFKDSFEVFYIAEDPTVNGTKVTVVGGADPNASMTGRGSSGTPARFDHIVPPALSTEKGSGVVFMRPAQMVRYCIMPLNLDPDSTVRTPCLVRDQGDYSGSTFVASPTLPQQVITENVTGFRAFLSADSGRNWVGQGSATWDATKGALNTQLGTTGRSGFKTVSNDLNWFRSIPVLVRVDVTTRTATRRTEYSAAGNALAYREQTQSLVLIPRHFGLTMN